MGRVNGTGTRPLFLALAGLLLAPLCSAATLLVGQGAAVPGGAGAAIPVVLRVAWGEEVSAVQFDIAYDEAALDHTDLSPGASAASAGKQISATPFAPGILRVVVAGLNQTPIPDGALVEAYFAVSPDAPGGYSPIGLGLAALSDPYGNPVELAIVPGGIEILRPEGEGEKSEGEAEGNAAGANEEPDADETSGEDSTEDVPAPSSTQDGANTDAQGTPSQGTSGAYGRGAASDDSETRGAGRGRSGPHPMLRPEGRSSGTSRSRRRAGASGYASRSAGGGTASVPASSAGAGRASSRRPRRDEIGGGASDSIAPDVKGTVGPMAAATRGRTSYGKHGSHTPALLADGATARTFLPKPPGWRRLGSTLGGMLMGAALVCAMLLLRGPILGAGYRRANH